MTVLVFSELERQERLESLLFRDLLYLLLNSAAAPNERVSQIEELVDLLRSWESGR